MSHIVKDLAIPAGSSTSSDWNVSGDKLADWVYDVYRGSQENVRCMMGYIVNLTVILDDISGTTSGNVTESAALKVMGAHVRSGRRDSIHRDIRSFVKETREVISRIHWHAGCGQWACGFSVGPFFSVYSLISNAVAGS